MAESGRIALCGLALIAGLHTVAARAGVPAPTCEAGSEVVSVRFVGNDWSLTLADGRVIRLAGIDPVLPTPSAPTIDEDGRRRLAEWLTRVPVTLRPLAGVADRWGRVPALAFASPSPETGSAPQLVATALVDAGLARGRPEPGVHACWPALMAAEAAARAAGLGLWSDPRYAIRDAADIGTPSDAAGGLTLVEGAVAHVGQTRSRLYVDLGPIHRSVALRLARRDAFILDQLGMGQDGLVGRLLRVRGLLDGRGGAHIDVVDADQVELVGAPPVPPSPEVAPAR